ncbi:MAG: hypothetical protein HYZ23_04045 [Chloroflexi bacterium]|nr:hypothetical protein [Chloroflexota bacterium]
MAQDSTSLEGLVLGYFRQVGALVEPPAYGAYEILLPDEAAARWGISPHQKIVFDAAHQQDGVTFLHYGHALIETIAEELCGQSANGQFFINNVRPEKPGFASEIEKAFSLPNSKIFFIHAEKEKIRHHHYARFNFKVSLVADEKRELVLPVWMDLQNGYPVSGAEIERLGILDEENQFLHAPSAPAFWNDEPALTPGPSPERRGEPALSPKTLSALLERARQAVPHELGETLSNLQKRLAHFLELDRARLNDYYDHLLKDAKKRLQKTEEDRRAALEAKIGVIQAERESKLLDVEQKYHLRIQLELVNLAIISVPKLDLMVEIRKRISTIQRAVTWNPLLHTIEPLLCDVCNRGGMTLHLCENGHLVHAECLAPQCVECKRTYCQACAQEVTECVVCARPICAHSLTRCKECQRVTCAEHAGECHALDGEPRKIVAGGEKVEETEPASGKKEASAKVASASGVAKKSVRKEIQKAKPIPQKFGAPPKPLADYVEVYSDPAEGTITAYMMRRQSELAVHWWAMTDEGISVNCRCEKMWNCESNGMVFRPSDDIERQMSLLLTRFREEYNLPDKKTRYFQIRLGKPFEEKKLKIPSGWRDEAILEKARKGFDELSKRK